MLQVFLPPPPLSTPEMNRHFVGVVSDWINLMSLDFFFCLFAPPTFSCSYYEYILQTSKSLKLPIYI